MQKTYIQTVYLPQENVLFLDDWLNYHTSIGIDHFFMYDNTGSSFREPIEGYDYNLMLDSKNKYGEEINIGLDQALEMEEKIFKKYPVTKVIWRPIKDEQITYGQMDACIDFSTKINEGLCAFIDIDEFIVKKEEFCESRMFQKRYKSRWEYKSVFDCDQTFEIDTTNWSSKVILDMQRFTAGGNIHFKEKDLKISKSWFNHYNHNKNAHEWLLTNYTLIDYNWKPRPYEEVFVIGEKLSITNWNTK